MSKKNKYLIAGIIVIVGIAIAIGIVIFLLTNKNETRKTEEVSLGVITSISCVTQEDEGAFFENDQSIDHTHKVVALFKNDRLDDISYEYIGSFESDKRAEVEVAEMHANYNNYLGDKGSDPEKLTPVFNNNGTKVRILLYADSGKLNVITAPIFFMDADEFYTISRKGSKDIENMYESKGFKCEKHD